ncbi:MAG: type II toxin-antitoxin system death-on-curing family toxin [Clostridium sp.]|nr:type II toxin-antitoxin system death-on-curing family toxin [Clostridium sp.]
MVKLSKEQIILLHSMAINKTGGLDGIRDEGLLESAINSPFQSFGGVELFPQTESKAAHLAFNIINNHPFLDGNKRIGILVMMVFLEVNNIKLQCSDEDIIDLGLGIAENRYNSEHIEEWIYNHIV